VASQQQQTYRFEATTSRPNRIPPPRPPARPRVGAGRPTWCCRARSRARQHQVGGATPTTDSGPTTDGAPTTPVGCRSPRRSSADQG